mgnify:CR=1 FL=1
MALTAGRARARVALPVQRPFVAVAVVSRPRLLGVVVTMVEAAAYKSLNEAARRVRSAGPDAPGVPGYGCRVGSVVLPALHVSQQLVQCAQPKPLLQRQLVGLPVRVVAPGVDGGGVVSEAAPGAVYALPSAEWPAASPRWTLCACLMLWDRARFVDEWARHHQRAGVEAVFVCDNESQDNLPAWARWLNWTVPTHYMQLPGDHMHQGCLAQCALQAYDKCDWLAATDIDEFLHAPSQPATGVAALLAAQGADVGAVLVPSLLFLPSDHVLEAPPGGVVKNYDCRRQDIEPRVKSIVRLSALHPTLANVIHWHLLRPNMSSVTMAPDQLVLYHYKMQAWHEYWLKSQRRAGAYSRANNATERDSPPSQFVVSAHGCSQPDNRSQHDTTLRDWTLASSSNKMPPPPPGGPPPLWAPTLVIGTGGPGSGLYHVRVLAKRLNLSDTVATAWPLLVRDSNKNFMQLQPPHRPPMAHVNANRFARIILHLRHPLVAVASIMHSYGPAEWDFIQRHTPAVRSDDPSLMRRALRHWFSWNLLAERVADAWYLVENSTIAHACRALHGMPPSVPPACSSTPGLDRPLYGRRATESALHVAAIQPPLTWDDLLAADPDMAPEVQRMARRYGYPD